MALAAFGAVAIVSGGAFSGPTISGVAAQGPTTQVFEFTGGTQTYVVPANVCSISVDAFGAEGGRGANPDGRRSDGGRGGRATTTVSVTPEEVLLVRVGGRGNGRIGGFNGGGDGGDADEDDGGGGGGASDVRRAPFDFPDRIVVAGGGGGGGADADGDDATKFNGGPGGGLVGVAGRESDSSPPTPPGGGGTQTAGGSAPSSFDLTAERGSFGQGGKGGLGPSIDDSGGGGGGGWYGGGGGAGEDDDLDTDGGAGGGGGSGFGPAGVDFETGVRSGDGLVEITPLPGGCDIAFDWTMPDRFGFDKNNDGLIDYYPPSGNLVIEPDGWRVDFTQTEPATCDQSLRRTWFIDGQEVLANDPQIIFFHPTSCTFAYTFAEEDVYDVQMEVRDNGGTFIGLDRHEVAVQDWLIVALGDSVTSGEGVPDLTKNQGGGTARWQSERCHRSGHAGAAEAARNIENLDPRTSVTFVHLACSGAEIRKGLINDYKGIVQGTGEPRPPSQVEQIRARIPNREIDAILVSIGANDVDFSTIVGLCVVQANCHLNAGKWLFELQVADLPQLFGELSTKLQGPTGVPELPARRIYFTEYFDPTRYDDASICGSPLPDGSGDTSDKLLHDSPVAPVLGISVAEAEWASNEMLVGINNAVRAATLTHGWSYIGFIRSLFLTHGYCANATWIVPYTASQADQGDGNGTLHPNILGHFVYAQKMLERLTVEFYASGNLKNPRAPGS